MRQKAEQKGSNTGSLALVKEKKGKELFSYIAISVADRRHTSHASLPLKSTAGTSSILMLTVQSLAV